jgi:hypothetical protein
MVVHMPKIDCISRKKETIMVHAERGRERELTVDRRTVAENSSSWAVEPSCTCLRYEEKEIGFE